MSHTTSFKIDDIKNDFPVLKQQVHGYPLVYLDNAATTQKPQQVIDEIQQFYTHNYATVHRGIYTLGEQSTAHYNEVRKNVATFINASSEKTIVFTKGCTDAINLVMHGFGRKFFKPGDEIILSAIEHHANWVPWQQLAKEKGLELKIIPVNDLGELDVNAFKSIITPKTVFLAVGHVSNVLGTIHPVKQLIEIAHSHGIKVLIDGAQAIPHLSVDVSDLDCDFYCFSAHKLYGPTGVGILYAKSDLLEIMDPYQLGGDMIETVTLEKTTFAPPPLKFEAGTPPIAQVIGLGAAIAYISSIGLDAIAAYEQDLLTYATQKMKAIDGIRILGEATNKASVISFLFSDIHPHDIGTILDTKGIAIRAGHHCSQPTMQRFGVSATARASFAFYNTFDDIDRLIEGIVYVKEVMT